MLAHASSIDQNQSVTVRPARPGDAVEIADMANALNAQHGKPDNLYSAALIEREAFGAQPLCEILVADLGGRAVGYALMHEMFNSDTARRGLWLTDLYVRNQHRSGGIGTRLLEAVAARCIEKGLASVWWGVTSDNLPARRFYEGLGARDEDARILELDGPALARLAGKQAP